MAIESSLITQNIGSGAVGAIVVMLIKLFIDRFLRLSDKKEDTLEVEMNKIKSNCNIHYTDMAEIKTRLDHLQSMFTESMVSLKQLNGKIQDFILDNTKERADTRADIRNINRQIDDLKDALKSNKRKK